jgi:hypothetical protein
MKTQIKAPVTTPPIDNAIVWIEPDQAIVVCHLTGNEEAVEVLRRAPTESPVQFRVRTVDQVADEPRVLVSGSAGDRTAFERTYVAITHRPDRLADVVPTVLT